MKKVITLPLNIDFTMLKEQKNTILKMMDKKKITKKEEDALTGIIGIIDAIQDYSVDIDRLPKNKVFNLTSKNLN